MRDGERKKIKGRDYLVDIWDIYQKEKKKNNNPYLSVQNTVKKLAEEAAEAAEAALDKSCSIEGKHFF